jgi:HD-GYP domain-containing protein (c-di-GMP phosphodiesterase class II)
MDILENITHHGRRVAYISLRLGERLGFTKDALFDLGSLALLHDVGATQSLSKQSIETVRRDELEKHRDHCVFGQRILDNLGKFSNLENIILYHHENFDGTGFFGKVGREIPMMSQIISLADTLERQHFSRASGYRHQDVLRDVVEHTGTLFNPLLTEHLRNIARTKTFWLDLEPQNIEFALIKYLPAVHDSFDQNMFHVMAETISAIVDAKSTFTNLHCKGLERKALQFAMAAGFSPDSTEKFRLAALLHDIGKLVVPTAILNKPTSLSTEELEIIHQHPYYTEKTLRIMGLDTDIVRWASNHHEKLNGEGYPKGLIAADMDYESRALAALDIYQALTEERPYRTAYAPREAKAILQAMAQRDELDKTVCGQIERIFDLS